MHFSKPPLGTPLDWENPLNDETVLALAMNEGHGDVVQDMSLNGNHGTLHNFAFPPTAASGWNPGMCGAGLNSDGVDDMITCGSGASIDLSSMDAHTISIILNTDDTADNRIFDKAQPYLRLNAANATSAQIRYKIDFGAGTDALAVTSTRILHNVWYVLTAVYNEDCDKRCKIYFNGDLQPLEIDQAGAGTMYDDSSVGLNICAAALGAAAIQSHIDQPRIMNRVWSAKEVKDYAINPWQVYLDEDN